MSTSPSSFRGQAVEIGEAHLRRGVEGRALRIDADDKARLLAEVGDLGGLVVVYNGRVHRSDVRSAGESHRIGREFKAEAWIVWQRNRATVVGAHRHRIREVHREEPDGHADRVVLAGDRRKREIQVHP